MSKRPSCVFRNGIALRYKISGPSVEDRRAIARLDDRDMVGVNRNRWIAWQSGVGARFVDDDACRCALSFVKDAMLENVPALLGETAIGNIDAAQSGVIGDKRPGDGRGPRKKPQPVEQGCLPCTCMRRRSEDNLGHALQEVGGFRASLLLLLYRERFA